MDSSELKKESDVFEILSLFSGGGFLDLGFLNQGFSIKEAVEIEPNFIQSYNFGLNAYFATSNNFYVKNKLVHHAEIAKPTDASNLKEQKRLKIEHAGITGIIGGPPCQDYSVGGKIGSYFKIIKSIKPDFLFFENVGGLYLTKKHRVSFDAFVCDIEKQGYVVWHDLLNVLDYGYPQDRPRIALVAFRKEIVRALKAAGYVVEKDNQKMKLDANDNYVFKWPTPKYISPKDEIWPRKWAFGNEIVDYPFGINRELCVENAIGNIPDDFPNQNECFTPISTRFQSIEEGDTNRKSFKRLHRFKYSPTVAYGNNEVHLHPTKPRRLTVREGLRLQTVPDEYILPGDVPLTHKFKLISNGVPTAIAELLAKEIRRTLLLYHVAIRENNGPAA
jgi:DNA (cytosine-5)-methyltransferase 1